MDKEFFVIKRNGSQVPFDIDKIHRVIEWAVKDLNGVSLSDIEINAQLSLKEGITSRQIHEVLIESAANLISLKATNYQYVAARLLNYQLRKDVWGGKNAPRLLEFVQKGIKELAIYEPSLLEWYTEAEINKLDESIIHERDMDFTYAGIRQLCDKYLMQNRVTKQIYETPQFAYMLCAMTFFHRYPKDTRLGYVKMAYNYFSRAKVNLPTPIMGGMRSTMRSFASCCLVDVDDSMESIFASVSAVGHATAKRYGIGINMGRMRAINTPIRGGEVVHTGVVPFLKIFESTAKSCQQGGLRGGGGTVTFPIWHYEIEDILQLKNTSGTEENRVRKLDYCISFSRLFYDRFIKDEDVTLFSPHEVPALYDSFGLPEFDELYKKAEKDKSIKYKKTISARKLFSLDVKELIETGRIYLMNIDHANQHSPWVEKVNMTNLCVAPETLLLTSEGHKPIAELMSEEVEVWNGKQWSKTRVEKTGTEQSLVKVILSDGRELDCTPYHKWYTIESYTDQAKGRYTEKRTHELKEGDKLIKLMTPVIDGNEPFLYPYTHGAFCGDGTYENSGSPRITLYGVKRDIAPHLDQRYTRDMDKDGRLSVVLPLDLPRKFVVPLRSSVETKIKWLEGYLDMDGCIARNGPNESIQVVSIEPVFIREVQMLLQTLGVVSKIVIASEAMDRLMPDGRGGYAMYPCQRAERLLVSSIGLHQLSQLGFAPNRLTFNPRLPQREAAHFVRVVKVVDEGRKDDTYCVNEPLEHKAVFNGVLTGNCVEILQPTIPLKSLDDPDAEIGVCVLSAINWLEIQSEAEMEKVCDIIVRMLDELIDYQEYFCPAARNFATKRRSLGVGVTNLAAFLAKHELSYGDKKAANLVDEWMEKQQYYLLKASAILAGEKGRCEKYSQTKYSLGVYPLDTYKRDVDEVVTRKPSMDWDALAALIAKNGLRHSTLTAHMPVESSSVIQNATNGIEPPRSLFSYKGSKARRLPFLVPHADKWRNRYTFAFEMKDNTGYLNIVAALQKWTDMAISVNLYYSYPLDDSQVIKDMLYHYKMGGKTIYYANVNDDNKQDLTEASAPEEDKCSSGACTI